MSLKRIKWLRGKGSNTREKKRERGDKEGDTHVTPIPTYPPPPPPPPPRRDRNGLDAETVQVKRQTTKVRWEREREREKGDERKGKIQQVLTKSSTLLSCVCVGFFFSSSPS